MISKPDNPSAARNEPRPVREPSPSYPARFPPELEWEPLVPLIGRANAALARYDGLIQGLVHPELLLAPLATREAVLSSRIEGTQATLVEVLEEEADPGAPLSPRSSEIEEILNYRRAIQEAVEELESRPISLNMIRRIHRTLLAGVRGASRAPGDFRRVQNYIGPPGAGIESATYVPPPPNEMLSLLDDLEKYLHADERDPIIQIGLIHAQFELIHPFLDGNGRVGRILIPLFFFSKGLIKRPAFYLSAYLEAHREEYYGRLAAISSARDHQTWVRFFLIAVAEQSDDDTRRVQSMLDLYERMKEVVVERTRSRYAIATLDTLSGSPVFSSPGFVERSRIPSASASRILKDLEEEGIVKVVRPGRGRRPTIWEFPALIEIVH